MMADMRRPKHKNRKNGTTTNKQKIKNDSTNTNTQRRRMTINQNKNESYEKLISVTALTVLYGKNGIKTKKYNIMLLLHFIINHLLYIKFSRIYSRSLFVYYTPQRKGPARLVIGIVSLKLSIY